MKRVQIRSFFWSVFSCIRTKHGDLQMYRVRIQENTDQEKLRIWALFTQWRSWKTLLTFLSCSFAIPWKVLWKSFRDLLQILLLHQAHLSKLINFYSPWNHQKIHGFLMISAGYKLICLERNIRTENTSRYLEERQNNFFELFQTSKKKHRIWSFFHADQTLTKGPNNTNWWIR